MYMLHVKYVVTSLSICVSNVNWVTLHCCQCLQWILSCQGVTLSVNKLFTSHNLLSVVSFSILQRCGEQR